MAYSNYLEDIINNEVLRNVGYTPPATVYLALYTSNPTDADSGTEVSGGGYARQAITFNASSGGVCTNSSTHAFTASGVSWGSITHVGIRDASTGGNLLRYGALTTPRTINDGDTLNFAATSISVSTD